jgi:hypothetical protein
MFLSAVRVRAQHQHEAVESGRRGVGGQTQLGALVRAACRSAVSTSSGQGVDLT